MPKLTLNKNYVIDASVLLKPFLAEEESDIVLSLFELHQKQQITLSLPELYEYEIGNILIRKKSTKGAIVCLQELSVLGLNMLPIEYIGAQNIIKFIEAYDGQITYYDASYHCLAKAFKTKLITADKKYYHKTKQEGDILLLSDIAFKA